MKFILDAVGALFVILFVFFVYQKYGDDIKLMFSDDDAQYSVYIKNVAVSVTVADDLDELTQGLSGVESLSEFEGKFFIFPNAQRHGIWMKDMQFPIDIMWFDNDLKLIHIEHDIHPSTYDAVFAPDTDARFVLETNAHFVKSLGINVGDTLSLPAAIIPADIKRNLQE